VFSLWAVWQIGPLMGLFYAAVAGPDALRWLRRFASKSYAGSVIQFEDYNLRVQHPSGDVVRVPYSQISHVGRAGNCLVIEYGTRTVEADASAVSPESLYRVVEQIRAQIKARAPSGAMTREHDERAHVLANWQDEALEVEFSSARWRFSARFLEQMELLVLVTIVVLGTLTNLGVLSGVLAAFWWFMALASGAALANLVWNRFAPTTKLQLTREAVIVTTWTVLRLPLNEIQRVEVNGGKHAAIAIQATGALVEIRADGNSGESLRDLQAQIFEAKASYMNFLESDAAADPRAREQLKTLIRDASEGK